MSNSTALITEMGILVGIFLLGLLAKLFPRRTGNHHHGEHGSFVRNAGGDQGAGIRDRVDSR
jgi:hypothetical protein